MAYDFPSSPSVNQLYPTTPVAGQPQYKWSGYAWIAISTGTAGAPAGTQVPLMDGTGAVGVSVNYSREDHVHPSDTSRFPASGGVISGNVNITGQLTVVGLTSFNNSVNINGAGSALNIGQDLAIGMQNASAHLYFTSGAKVLNYDGTTFSFAGAPLAVYNGGVTATTFTTGVSAVSQLGDVHCARGPNSGVVFLGTSDGAYLYYDGSAFSLQGGPLNLEGSPSVAAHATSKSYVDAQIATRLAVAGGQTTTGGFRSTAYARGTVSAGQTVTPDAYNGNYQYYYSTGAHTFATPANDCAIDFLVVNQAGAGAITFSGYNAVKGDTYVTTVDAYFLFSVRRIAGYNILTILRTQ